MSIESKKTKKVRKGQTEEEFQIQKGQFFEEGPTINTDEWLYDATSGEDFCLDENQKTDRVVMLHACEKAYFNRDYSRCLELILAGEKLFGVNQEDTKQEKESEFESAGIKVKKSAKIEKHILELLEIKERCIKNMQA